MTEYYARSVYDIIPKMDYPPGDPNYTIGDMIITGSSQRASTFPPYFKWSTWRAFNGSVAGTKDPWVATTAACWLQMYIGMLDGHYYDVTNYTLTSGPAGTSLDTTPRNWTFSGSNDGITWTLLDTRTNEIYWGYGEQRVYTLASPGDYTYYKLNVTHNNYSISGSVIGEFSLRGRNIFLAPDAAGMGIYPAAGMCGIDVQSALPNNGIYALLRADIGGIMAYRKIKISSFSLRKENGETKYISVVLPSLVEADSIADMADGTLHLWRMNNGVATEIGNLALSDIRIDEGGKNQSITLQANA